MKATLEFNLDEPSDVQAHLRAIKSIDLVLALHEIDEYLRVELKYNEKLNDAEQAALQRVRDEYYTILSSKNISVDELIS